MISPKTTSILSRLPSFYRSGEELNVLYRLLEAYSGILEGADNDLIRVMRSHWVDKADNEGSEGLDAQQKGDLDKIFALWLESLGTTSLLRQTGRRSTGQGGEADDAAYRERIKALIGVIRQGASTLDGIRAVVAANLGILGNDPVAVYARSQIRIEEYMPKATPTVFPNLALYTPFLVTNTNPVHTPIGFYVKVTGALPIPIVGFYLELPAVRQTLGCPANLVQGDELYLFFDKTALLNGQPLVGEGTGIQLPPGVSRLQAGAKLGYPGGKFDQTRFEQTTFDIDLAEDMGRFDVETFDEAAFALPDPVFELHVLQYSISPGSFTVTIPWDSPGFTAAFTLAEAARGPLEKLGLEPPVDLETKTYATLEDLIKEPWMTQKPELTDSALEAIKFFMLPGEDRFSQMDINPRAQIRPIVDRVRAAGVYAVINYEKRFSETLELSDTLAIAGRHTPFLEPSALTDDLNVLTLQKTDPEYHDLSDQLTLSGMFDFMSFGSLNGFG